MRHQQVFTVASSAVLEKFAGRVLTRNFDIDASMIASVDDRYDNEMRWLGRFKHAARR
jgi:hypothetical protein